MWKWHKKNKTERAEENNFSKYYIRFNHILRCINNKQGYRYTNNNILNNFKLLNFSILYLETFELKISLRTLKNDLKYK